jgi:hypothetical protein
MKLLSKKKVTWSIDHIQDVIGGFEIKITPEKLIVESPASRRLGRNDVQVVELRVDGREGTAFCDRSLLRKRQLKIVYVVHSDSDNAAQHFHSLVQGPSTFGWIDRVYWAFGCPGHGKGPWDGIGALMKTMLRHSIDHDGPRYRGKWRAHPSPSHDTRRIGEDCANHMRGQLGEECGQGTASQASCYLTHDGALCGREGHPAA